MRFNNQSVIVTGSTRGIGKEIAAAFAKEGAIVAIIGRNEESAKKISDEFRSLGYKTDFFGCDVANEENVKETVNKFLDKYKRVDILVNNAGITRDNLLLRMNDSEWNDVIDINLKGTFYFTKSVSKPMLKAKAGKIINISSIIGITGNVGQANYAASKAGIIGFTKSIARELASRGITANTVAPGYIETEMTEHIKSDVRENILMNIPVRRFGTANDVAGVCLFLASKEADYITGQTIIIDGGMAI